jgi:hypothetical protein
VPGAIEAWDRLADHGRKGLDALLQTAIHYAENGYVVHGRVASDWAACVDLLRRDAAAARIFLPGGGAPKAGSLHRQPELAATLKTIARQGRAGFYEGAVAEDIVGYLRQQGGLHEPDDFAEARGEYVAPIGTAYRGVDIHQIPPNNQGITALIMLNILSGFDLAGLDPRGAERLHLEVEAARLAFRDRDALVADPRQAEVPVARLLSADYAAALRRRIDPDRAATDLPPALLSRSDTVYLCVVDRDRNAVSFINSIYHSFGSGLVSPARRGAAEPGRGLSRRSGASQPHRAGPAAPAHDHAGPRGQGRAGGDAVRRHGRRLSALRSRAFPDQCPGFRLRPAGGPGSAARVLRPGRAGGRARPRGRGGPRPDRARPPRGVASGRWARAAISIDWETGVLTGGPIAQDGCARLLGRNGPPAPRIFMGR